jgi:hypothetical protein
MSPQIISVPNNTYFIFPSFSYPIQNSLKRTVDLIYCICLKMDTKSKSWIKPVKRSRMVNFLRNLEILGVEFETDLNLTLHYMDSEGCSKCER